ncbi:MAG: DUF58 domain-containing protein [Clostridia bacterium]|nr:DUF58 domain-containing protein [Clostridia bacterium]
MGIFAHWLLYLGTLCGFVAFAVNYTEWFSYYLLLVALGLPLLSLLLALPPWIMTTLTISHPMSAVRGTQATVLIYAQKTTKYFRLPVRLTVRQENLTSARSRLRRVRFRFTPCTGRQGELRESHLENAVRVPVDTAHTAMIRTSAEHIRMTDPLGLFSFPVRVMGPREVLTLVMPVPRQPVSVPEQWKHESSTMVPAKGFTEQSEIRDYRPGDPMRAVHWKLSAKTDGVLVREPVEHPRLAVGITFDRPADDDRADAVFDCLIYLLDQICRDDGTLRSVVIWRNAAGADESAELESMAEAGELFAKICAGGTPEEPVTAEQMKSSPLLAKLPTGYHIGADGGITAVNTAVHYDDRQGSTPVQTQGL